MGIVDPLHSHLGSVNNSLWPALRFRFAPGHLAQCPGWISLVSTAAEGGSELGLTDLSVPEETHEAATVLWYRCHGQLTLLIVFIVFCACVIMWPSPKLVCRGKPSHPLSSFSSSPPSPPPITPCPLADLSIHAFGESAVWNRVRRERERARRKSRSGVSWVTCIILT